MQAPYGLEISDSCTTCTTRSSGYFCDFDAELVKAFEALKYATVFPKGAVLFVEGQSPRGSLCFALAGLNSRLVRATASRSSLGSPTRARYWGLARPFRASLHGDRGNACAMSGEFHKE